VSTTYTPIPGDAVLMEGEDPVRMRLALPGDRTVEIPAYVWHGLKQHIRDVDPIRAELKRSLDDALTEIQRLSNDRDHWEQEAANWKRAADSPFRQGLDCSPANVEALSNAVHRLERERDEAAEQVALWKALAERQDNTAPIRTELSSVKRERDSWRRKYEGAQANAEYIREQYGPPDEVAQMKAAIVRQAREISLLSGESE
jgi:chromosome segregation ATPase